MSCYHRDLSLWPWPWRFQVSRSNVNASHSGHTAFSGFLYDNHILLTMICIFWLEFVLKPHYLALHLMEKFFMPPEWNSGASIVLFCLWRCLSVTLPLRQKKKPFNLDHNFWPVWGRAFIFHMYIPGEDTFPSIPIFFYLATLTVTFDLHNLSKNINLDHNFWIISGRAFIFHMHVSYDEASQSIPKVLTVTFDQHILKL